ncbi:MAG: FtsH protease activity modulator HflK [Alphaproteobacteria bacterium]|nr:FtsH protease activity modulator HflK [Alphaproteobacteria bacterium]
MNWDQNTPGPWGNAPKDNKKDNVVKMKKVKPTGTDLLNNKKSFAGLVAIILGLWFATGFYMVQPDEQGVQLIFGKWDGQVKEAGLHYNLPNPIGMTFTPQVTKEQQLEIGYRSSRGNNINVPEESLMLTGDGNIIDIDFVVTWRVIDAGKFLFNIRNPQDTLKKVSESAMREIIGKSELQKALADERPVIQQETLTLIQKTMDEYESGIQVNEVKLQRVDPPVAVIDAFNDVQRALSDKETLSNEADAYRNKVIPEAKGKAEKMLQEADAYKAKVVNGAKGEAERFNKIYDSYKKSKDITKTRMYIETMEKVMKNSKKVIMDKGSSNSFLPHMNINKGELK